MLDSCVSFTLTLTAPSYLSLSMVSSSHLVNSSVGHQPGIPAFLYILCRTCKDLLLKQHGRHSGISEEANAEI